MVFFRLPCIRFNSYCPTGALISHHNTTLLQYVSISALSDLYAWWPEIHIKELFPPHLAIKYVEESWRRNRTPDTHQLSGRSWNGSSQHEIMRTESLIYLSWWVWVPLRTSREVGNEVITGDAKPWEGKREGWKKQMGRELWLSSACPQKELNVQFCLVKFMSRKSRFSIFHWETAV